MSQWAGFYLSLSKNTRKAQEKHRNSMGCMDTKHSLVVILTKRPLRACYCSQMQFVRYKKAPAGMLLLRNAIFRYKKAPAGMLLLRHIFLGTKSPCGHVTAQKYYFLGTKKPVWACYCSEMLFFRYKKAPVGMLLLRNAMF